MAPVHLGSSQADNAVERQPGTRAAAHASSQDPSESRPSREAILEGSALEAARIWATSCVEELAREGRPIEGGWPGTMPEARGRAGGLAARTLARLSMPALAHDELG